MSTNNASIRYVTVVAALLCAMAGVGIGSPGCGAGSSGGGGSPGADSGRADSTTATDSASAGVDSAMAQDSASAGDSTTAGDAGSDSAAATDSNAGDSTSAGDSNSVTDGSDAGLAADATGVVATIALSGQPTAMAIDNTRNQLYVALATGLGANGGFAIIDTTSDTVTATIPAPTVDSGNGPGPFEALTLDTTANLLYACDLNATPLVYVFDVTADAFKNRFSIVGTGVTAPWIASMVVNPATSTLYVGALDTSGNASKVGVINTTSDTLTTEITLTDLATGFGLLGGSIALDTTNNLLFACANGPTNGPGAVAVDTINTTTNLETGLQQQLAGSDLGCQGGPGYAVDVTLSRSVTDGGVAGYFYSLEPFSVALPAGFVPDSVDTNLHSQIYILGHDAQTGAIDSVSFNIPHGEDAGVKLTLNKNVYPASESRTQKVKIGDRSPPNVYVTLDIFSDAGTSPENAVYDIQISNGDGGP